LSTLFIKIENDQLIEHPVTKSNLQQIYRSIDLDTEIPQGWILFIRNPPPNIDRQTQKVTFNGYKIVNGIAYDDWLVEDLSENYYSNDIQSISTEDEV